MKKKKNRRNFTLISFFHFYLFIHLIFFFFFEGGVFIATLFGLALAMITLAGEVIYYRRRNTVGGNKQKILSSVGTGNKIMQRITQKRKFQLKPATTVAFGLSRHHGSKSRISHISVNPKNFPFKD